MPKPKEDSSKIKYPFVNIKDFLEGGWKVPIYYAAHRTADYLRDSYQESLPPSDKRSKLSIGLIDYLNWQSTLYEQRAISRANKTFPKLMAWRGFYNDPTEIDTMFTVEMYDHEFPVFIRDKNDPLPTDSELIKNIQTVRDKMKSPYDPRGAIDELYDEEFDGIPAQKYTRGDIKNDDLFPEPLRLRQWLVKDDTWRIQQYGDFKPKSMTVDGISYTVREYMKPNKINSFVYWAIGDKIYDFVDAPFDVIQATLIKNSPPGFRQFITKEEYKMIAKIRRSFFTNGSRRRLVYDLTEEPGYRERIPERPKDVKDKTAKSKVVPITPVAKAA
ncbi:MAG: hypothetical protein ABIH52_00410 [Candidatus Aenigmatarchaeota archaeon]